MQWAFSWCENWALQWWGHLRKNLQRRLQRIGLRSNCGDFRWRKFGASQERGLPGLATNSISFCFLFVKTHWFAWRANQWPLIGESLFSFVPPSNSLVSVSYPRRAFWADPAAFSGPRLTSCVASGTTEIQGHRQEWCTKRRGPRTPSTTTDANLDCALVENAPFYTDPWFWKVNRNELS